MAEVSGGLTKNSKRDALALRRPYLSVANVYANRLELDDVGMIGVQESELPRVLLRPGDLLVVEGNGSLAQLGRVAVWNGAIADCLHQNHLIKVRPKAGISPWWLLYWLLSPEGRNAIERVGSSTSGLHTLSISKVEALPVRVASGPEQRRIVAEIEKHFTRLDAAVATLERVQAELERARASVLKAAVEGRLVPTEAELARAEGRTYEPASVLLERILEERRRKHEEVHGKKKYKPPVEPETEGLPELPKGWTWATVDQLGQEGRPICYGVLKAGPHHPGGVPLVRVTDVVSADLRPSILKHCNPAREEKFTRSRLAVGDLLVSKDGTIGRVAVVPEWLEGANVTQHVLRVAVHPLVSIGFLRRALEAPLSQSWMKGETKGVALQGVNVRDFLRLPVAIAPAAEQHRIVAEVSRRLSVLDALDQTVTRNLARCAALRQSILKRAFSGKLVPQDPSDEPASALLDRIRSSAVR